MFGWPGDNLLLVSFFSLGHFPEQFSGSHKSGENEKMATYCVIRVSVGRLLIIDGLYNCWELINEYPLDCNSIRRLRSNKPNTTTYQEITEPTLIETLSLTSHRGPLSLSTFGVSEIIILVISETNNVNGGWCPTNASSESHLSSHAAHNNVVTLHTAQL